VPNVVQTSEFLRRELIFIAFCNTHEASPLMVLRREQELKQIDAVFPADVMSSPPNPGKWLIHCHIPHHTTSNNTETHGGGLMTVIDVGGKS
jgi:hypothetical protein